MDQILIRGLPSGVKAALKKRAKDHHRSVEAEARALLTDALEADSVTMPELLGMNEGADIEFEPERLGLTDRAPNL